MGTAPSRGRSGPGCTTSGASRSTTSGARSSGGSPSGIYLYVRDADETFRKAAELGATVKRPLEDMFWGDRCGTVGDPFGYDWSVATRKEEVSPQELKRRHEEFVKGMKEGKC